MGMDFRSDSLEIVEQQPGSGVFHLYLNRPSARNALSVSFFADLPRALAAIDACPSASAVVISGRGPHFCSGIDLPSLQSILSPTSSSDPGRTRERVRRQILGLQEAFTAFERCRRPVLAAVNGACVGGGVDLVVACDVRYCTEDAYFHVKEVDLALAADLGTLQRLQRIVGYGNAAEMALTGRRVGAAEAKQMGLVSRVYKTREEMDSAVNAIALDIAEKSPLAVTGTKTVLLKSRDLTVEQGLDYVATWNAAMLISDDLEEAVKAAIQKRKPAFAKL